MPIEPWQSSSITLLGDAIHTMTPGQGVGANTASPGRGLAGAERHQRRRRAPQALIGRLMLAFTRAYFRAVDRTPAVRNQFLNGLYTYRSS